MNLQERPSIHFSRGDSARPATVKLSGGTDRAHVDPALELGVASNALASPRDAPDLPRPLTPGSHLTPADGACLMEAVSVLAGEPWSDAPRTTLPLLAHLARLVNDAMTSDARQALLALAPRLAGLSSADPAVQPRIAAMATRSALEWHPSRVVGWMHHAALRQVVLAEQSERTSATLRRRLYLHGPAQRAVETSVTAALASPRWRAAPPAKSAAADRRLMSLLERALELVEVTSVRAGPCRPQPADVGRAPAGLASAAT